MVRLLLILSVLFFFLSCNKTNQSSIYEQGRLEYRISYLNADTDNYDPSFLPKKMVLEFNQDYSINRIDGFMGFFKLGNITYFRNRRVKTHLKVLDQNYAFNGGRNEMMCCFDCMDGMRMENDTSRIELAGLKSNKIRITFPDGREEYGIYYTDAIKLRNPNASNPYSKVDGVLTQFRLIMGPYIMEFTATKFDPVRAPKSEMPIPEEATFVNRNEMVAILNRLMEQNK
jgi:hypothetical protein